MNPIKLNRRDALLCAGAATAAGLAGTGVSFLAGKSEAKGLLRPPGALAEKDFLASCIKCGQCIQVCPYHSLKLLDLADGIDMGTPYIDARDRGCYLCDLFPCILCCPSGALDSKVQTIGQVDMGVAWVHEPRSCWSYQDKPVTAEWIDRLKHQGGHTDLEEDLNTRLEQEKGKNCRLCEVVCAVPDRAQAIEIRNHVPVIGSRCVGCGACAEVCPPGIIEIKARKSYAELYEGKSPVHKEKAA